jgi:hypothetical protein
MRQTHQQANTDGGTGLHVRPEEEQSSVTLGGQFPSQSCDRGCLAFIQVFLFSCRHYFVLHAQAALPPVWPR